MHINCGMKMMCTGSSTGRPVGQGVLCMGCDASSIGLAHPALTQAGLWVRYIELELAAGNTAQVGLL